VRQAGSEAVLEGQKQDKIAPGFIVSTLPLSSWKSGKRKQRATCMSPCIASSGGLKKGQISACGEVMTDYTVSIVFCSLHMLVAEMGF